MAVIEKAFQNKQKPTLVDEAARGNSELYLHLNQTAMQMAGTSPMVRPTWVSESDVRIVIFFSCGQLLKRRSLCFTVSACFVFRYASLETNERNQAIRSRLFSLVTNN